MDGSPGGARDVPPARREAAVEHAPAAHAPIAAQAEGIKAPASHAPSPGKPFVSLAHRGPMAGPLQVGEGTVTANAPSAPLQGPIDLSGGLSRSPKALRNPGGPPETIPVQGQVAGIGTAGTGVTPPTLTTPGMTMRAAPDTQPRSNTAAVGRREDKSGSGDKPGTGESMAGPQAGEMPPAPPAAAAEHARTAKDVENPFGDPWWRAYESLSSRDARNAGQQVQGSGSGSGGTGPQAMGAGKHEAAPGSGSGSGAMPGQPGGVAAPAAGREAPGVRAVGGTLMLPMVSLQLGRWWRLAAQEGDIWCCVSFKDGEVAWKVVEKDGERCFLIHSQMQHVRGVRLHLPAHGCQVLELDMGACPHFSTERLASSLDLTAPESGAPESGPPPRPQREPSLDFTGGFAASERTHRAVFPAGCLAPHVNALLSHLPHIGSPGAQGPPAPPALHPGLPFGIPGLATLAAAMQSSAENTLMTMARLLQQMGIQQHLQAFDLEEQDTPSIGMGGESQRVSQEERKGQGAEEGKAFAGQGNGSSGDGTNGRKPRTEVGANFPSSAPGHGNGSNGNGKGTTVIGANFSKNGNGSSGGGNGHSGSGAGAPKAVPGDHAKGPHVDVGNGGNGVGHSGVAANFSRGSHDVDHHAVGNSGGSGNGASSIHPHHKPQHHRDADTNTTGNGNGHGTTATSHLRKAERLRQQGLVAAGGGVGGAALPGSPVTGPGEAGDGIDARDGGDDGSLGAVARQRVAHASIEEDFIAADRDADTSGDISNEDKAGRGSGGRGGSGGNGSGEGAGASNQLDPNSSGNGNSGAHKGAERAASSQLRDGKRAMDLEDPHEDSVQGSLGAHSPMGEGKGGLSEGEGAAHPIHSLKREREASGSGSEAAAQPMRVHHHKTSLGKRGRLLAKVSDEDTASSGIEDRVAMAINPVAGAALDQASPAPEALARAPSPPAKAQKLTAGTRAFGHEPAACGGDGRSAATAMQDLIPSMGPDGQEPARAGSGGSARRGSRHSPTFRALADEPGGNSGGNHHRRRRHGSSAHNE